MQGAPGFSPRTASHSTVKSPSVGGRRFDFNELESWLFSFCGFSPCSITSGGDISSSSPFASGRPSCVVSSVSFSVSLQLRSMGKLGAGEVNLGIARIEGVPDSVGEE